MSIQERIYYSLSPSFQNLLISAYGYKQFFRRYRNLDRLLSQIEEIENQSDNEKLAFQEEKLHQIIVHCEKNIPFYQKLFADYGVSSSQITSKKDLQRLPILDKKIIQKNINLFQEKGKKPKITQKTSGTTGTPFTIHMNQETYELAMALLVHHERCSGIPFGARKATFAGRLIKNINDRTPPFFRYNRAENQALFSTYHLGPSTFGYYVKELDHLKPEELIGYPSAIYNLSVLYQEHGITPNFKPRAIITNSETLFDWQRKTIEAVFDSQIYDYYGTAEYIVFARQENGSSYKIDANLGILELTDRHGVQKSEGSITATTLTNFTMPLIRYRIGDLAKQLSEFELDRILGRIDDNIVTPDNRRIGRTGEIFGFFDNIFEAQIIQHEISRCELLIVKSEKNMPIDEEGLKLKFRSKFGNDMTIEINYTEEIKKSKNGKFKAVISKIDQNQK